MNSMDEDEGGSSWWKSGWYNDPEIEGKVIGAIQARDKPSSGVIYRIFLFLCGLMLFFVGWITWNIGLPSEGESGAVGMNLKTFLFFIGLFVQFIIGPYFAFVSISNSGRLSPLMPKAQIEYFRLKGAILDREVYDHYWAALRDPNHEHHNEIIRYKWMDKVRWKHHPSDFFGYPIFTKNSGEETRGSLVPKSSDKYRNTNSTYDENGKRLFNAGPTHPLKRLFTLPFFLFFFSLISLPFSVINTVTSISNRDWEFLLQASISFSLLIALGYYLIRRNTDLFNADDNDDVSLDDLEERLRVLSERYLTIPKSMEE